MVKTDKISRIKTRPSILETWKDINEGNKKYIRGSAYFYLFHNDERYSDKESGESLLGNKALIYTATYLMSRNKKEEAMKLLNENMSSITHERDKLYLNDLLSLAVGEVEKKNKRNGGDVSASTMTQPLQPKLEQTKVYGKRVDGPGLKIVSEEDSEIKSAQKIIPMSVETERKSSWFRRGVLAMVTGVLLFGAGYFAGKTQGKNNTKIAVDKNEYSELTNNLAGLKSAHESLKQKFYLTSSREQAYIRDLEGRLFIARNGEYQQTAFVSSHGIRKSQSNVPQVNNSTSSNGLLEVIGKDLNQYRTYSVNEGSRKPSESLKKSGESLKEAGSSLVSTITFSYGNEEFKQNRDDDCRIKKPTKGFVKSVGGFFKRLSGPIFDRDAYNGLNPATGTVTYFGRLVGGAAGMGKNAANMITFGVGNNLIDPALDTGKNVVESAKHFVGAPLNTLRYASKPLSVNNEEVANKAVDWITTVPIEFASNIVEGEGFSNTENTQNAVARKGNTGVTLEFGGSGALLGYGVHKAVSHHGDNKSGTRTDDPGVGGGTGGRTDGVGVGTP